MTAPVLIPMSIGSCTLMINANGHCTVVPYPFDETQEAPDAVIVLGTLAHIINRDGLEATAARMAREHMGHKLQ